MLYRMNLSIGKNTIGNNAVYFFAFIFIMCVNNTKLIHGEFVTINTTLGLTTYDGNVQFFHNSIRGPGLVDLTKLTFQTTQHRKRRYTTLDNIENDISTSIEDDGSYIDIGIIHVPRTCYSHFRYTNECDLFNYGVNYGVGLTTQTSYYGKKIQWCCSMELLQQKKCFEYGRLFINATIFSGYTSEIYIPKYDDVSSHGSVVKLKDSGTYVMVMTNCNERNGRSILLNGTMGWKSVHGYLTKNQYGFMNAFIWMWIVYIILCVWYGYSVLLHRSVCTIVEVCILCVILFGFLVVSFKVHLFYTWNTTGYYPSYSYIYLMLNVLKWSISNCLFLTLSMGWGDVRESVAPIMCIIFAVGIFDIFIEGIAAMEYANKLHEIEDGGYNSVKLDDDLWIVHRSQSLRKFISNMFNIWTFGALYYTIVYIRTTSHIWNLDRYKKLSLIFVCYNILSIVFVSIKLKYYYIYWFCEGEVTYVFLLIGTAILWKPKPNEQQRYTNIGSSNDDNVDPTRNELELYEYIPIQIPSKMDSTTNNIYQRK